jgi:predicted kinase
MGREEERETLAGNRPEHPSKIDLDAASRGVENPVDAPEPDRRGKGADELAGHSAFERGDPDAVPSDVTETPEYQEDLAEARRVVNEGEAVVDDGRDKMPPTRYDRG